MEEFQDIFSKIILINKTESDLNSMIEKEVSLEIDVAYKIGKSVAVLHDGQIIGHLPRFMAKPAWLHLKLSRKLDGRIYQELDNGFQNAICFSALTRSPEVGIRLRFFFEDSVDGNQRISGSSSAKLFLTYALKHRLFSFPGITKSNCPVSLRGYFYQ